MVGFGGLAADYRRRALVLGPLALGNLRTYTPTQALPGTLNGRYGAYEVIAIVSAGATPVLRAYAGRAAACAFLNAIRPLASWSRAR